MSRIINISSKLDSTKPRIQIGESLYEVNDSLETMVKLEELMTTLGNLSSMELAIEIAIGKKAVKEINVKGYSFKNYKVLVAGIMAAIQDTDDLDSILSRFPDESPKV